MQFVPNLMEGIDVPEHMVGGVARVEIIDGSLVRVTFYKPPSGRTGVLVPACELLWTIPAWLAAREPLSKVAVALANGAKLEIALPGISPLHH